MSRMFYFNDMENGLKPYMDRLYEENTKLHDFIHEQMKEHKDTGIKEEIISFLADKGGSINGSPQYLDLISQLALNMGITAGHMEILYDYFKNGEADRVLDAESFQFVMTQGIEHSIPESDLRKIIFENTDMNAIYDIVVNYESGSSENGTNEDPAAADTSSDGGNIEVRHSGELSEQPEIVSSRAESYSDMFQSITSVINYTPNKDAGSIDEFKSKMEAINSTITKASADLGVCLTEMVAEMQNDKTTITRLNFLLAIQQKAFADQQMKLNEARNEISRLQFKIKQNEEAEMNRRAINQKIAELSNLSGTQLSIN